jgi:acyl-CoA thioesterase YciA
MQPAKRNPRPATRPARPPADQPRGELASRSLAMPTDTNPMGHVFGGWIMSLMGLRRQDDGDASRRRPGRHHGGLEHRLPAQPVQVGDTVCCYTDLIRLGRTSITLGVEVWVLRQGQGERIKVTDAEFTFVAVAEDGRKRALPIAPRQVRTA